MGDICVGTVLTPDPVYHARGAALAAGFPESVPVQVVNRFCSSGLMAVTVVANQIRSGQIEIGLAVGVESMSQKYVDHSLAPSRRSQSFSFPNDSPDNGAPPQSASIGANASAKDCLYPMGWTSENVAQDYNISRDVMDTFATQSFQRAEHAEKSGYFTKEIVPFTVSVNDKNPATGTTSRRRVTVTKDDGIRYGTTKESLLKIRSAFPQWGHGRTTGGNASQITDGAAAVLLMTRRKAETLGLPILGKHVSTAVAGTWRRYVGCSQSNVADWDGARVVGVPPRVMGIGPVYAIPMVLKHAGIDVGDVDLFEVYPI